MNLTLIQDSVSSKLNFLMFHAKFFLKKYSTAILILFVTLIYFLSLRGISGNINPYNAVSNAPPFETSLERGRYAQTISLAEYHTFNVDRYVEFLKPDLAWYSGHYYPAFPPGVSLISVPFYLVGKIFGYSQLMTYLVSPFFSILTVLAIIKCGQLIKLSKSAGVLSAFVFVISFALAYSTTLSAHIVSAFIITLCFLISLSIKKGENNFLKLGLLYFLYSLNLFIDYPNLFILMPVLIVTTFKVIEVKKVENKFKVNIPLGVFLAPLFVIAIVFIYSSFSMYHYQKPIAFTNKYNLQVLDIQGIKYEKLSNDLFSQKSYSSRFNLAKVYNGVNTLLISRDRGLLVYAPVFIIAIVGLLISAMKKQKWWELIFMTFIFNLIVYAAFDDPWGGWGFGPRYLIPSLPLLALLVGRGFDYLMKYGLITKAFVFVLLFYTSAISLLGALTTNAVPPSTESAELKIYNNFFLNWNYLLDHGTSSFVYSVIFKNFFSPLEYFLTLLLIIISFAAFFIFLIRKNPINLR